MNEEEIKREVLDRTVPSASERKKIMKAVGELRAGISGEMEARGVEAEVMLVGSIAKGTYLKDSLDIDLFVLFDTDYSKDEIKEHTLGAGKKILKEWRIQYAEHPYIRGMYGGYKVDIVPCYKVDRPSGKMSAVDRTPFHTEYIRNNLKNRNEVRLLKQFLKGIGCYGAEIKVRGFSGYLAELLIIRYGSFDSVLENSRKWKGKVVLSLTGGGGAGGAGGGAEGNASGESFPEDFVFIDPVDPSRNVAAALSPERLDFFRFAAGEYIRKPKIEFFFPNEVKPWPLEKIREQLENFIGICVPRPDVIDDILYSQVRKAAGSLEAMYRNHGFNPVESAYHVNEEIMIFVNLAEKEIPEKKIHMGPPEGAQEHVKAFISRWEGNGDTITPPYKKDGRWWVEIKREYVDARSLLEHGIEEMNLGKNLNELKDKARICEDGDFVKEEHASFWTAHLSGKNPWEW